MDGITFTFDAALVLQSVITVVLPVLVGLVTKKITSSGAKAVLLAGLSVVSSLLTEIMNATQSGATYDLGRGLLVALFTFIGAVSLHYGLFKPVGVAEKAQEVGMGKEPAFVDHTYDDLDTEAIAEFIEDDDEVEVDATPVDADYAAKH